MADDVTGAVRRTPRPTDDHQTPETGAPVAPGATNPATPVSQDAETVSDQLRASLAGMVELVRERIADAPGEPLGPDAAEQLAALRAKLADPGRVDVVDELFGQGLDRVDQAVAEFAALPECQACGGSGKDDHASPFEAPLAVHFAGPPCVIAGRRRQLCMWCGHVLVDTPVDQLAPGWPQGALIRVEDGLGTIEPYREGAELPPGCCALPDDEPAEGAEPVCPCDPETERCAKCADEAQETRAAADWPAEPEDGDRG